VRLLRYVVRLWQAKGVVLTCQRQAEIPFHLKLALEEVVEVVVDNLTPWDGIALARVLLVLTMKKVEPEAKEA